jgi:hypothetical protein
VWSSCELPFTAGRSPLVAQLTAVPCVNLQDPGGSFVAIDVYRPLWRRAFLYTANAAPWQEVFVVSDDLEKMFQ